LKRLSVATSRLQPHVEHYATHPEIEELGGRLQAAEDQPGAGYGLRREILSPLETLAQSVSTMAPTTTPAATIPLVCALAGNGTWLAYGLATVCSAAGRMVSGLGTRIISPLAAIAMLLALLGNLYPVPEGLYGKLPYIYLAYLRKCSGFCCAAVQSKGSRATSSRHQPILLARRQTRRVATE
jgi:hypothetical protein